MPSAMRRSTGHIGQCSVLYDLRSLPVVIQHYHRLTAFQKLRTLRDAGLADIHHHQYRIIAYHLQCLRIISYASSACEMVSEILQYTSDTLRLRPEEADCMYSGIMIDTNNFMTKTGVRTFEAAAFLRRDLYIHLVNRTCADIDHAVVRRENETGLDPFDIQQFIGSLRTKSYYYRM